MNSDVSDWWTTAIIDVAPGRINLRGHPIEALIGELTFCEVIWLLTRGTRPTPAQARLLEAALVAGVDHGPMAPSIAAARMAVTCGVGINAAMATAVGLMGDVHGGAGEQAVELFDWIDTETQTGTPLTEATSRMVARWKEDRGGFIPGFGHYLHKPVDPRAPRLLALVDEAVAAQETEGKYAEIARAVEQHLAETKGKAVPMNVDGATAVVFAELGFPGPLARGLFCLSRSVGALAHSYEQLTMDQRSKGPLPPHYATTYSGSNPMGDAAPRESE